MKKIKNFTKNTFSSLEIKNYRLYFFGQAISQTGSWMQTIALAWLGLKLTNSGTQLGLIAMAQYLPILLLGPLAGVIVDHFNKRTTVIITQILFAVLALLLWLLSYLNIITLWEIYIIATALGLVTAIDTPARHTFMYELVGPDKIGNSLALNGTLFNLTRVIGPAIAGVIIVSFGTTWCFFVNGISFTALLLGLYLMDPIKEAKKVFGDFKIKGQFSESINYVKNNPILKNVLLFMLVMGIFVYEFMVSVPLLAHTTFSGDARVYALLTSFMGLGSIFGGLYAASQPFANIKYVLRSMALLSFAMLLVALSPNLVVALIGMFIIGLATTNYTTKSNSLLQLNSSEEMRGRVLSLWNTVFIGTTPIGGPIIGYVSENFSPRGGFLLGALAGLAITVYGSLKGKET